MTLTLLPLSAMLAAAAGLPAARLAIEPCVSVRAPDVEQALALELGRRQVEPTHDGQLAPRFAFGCAGDQVLIRVSSADGERTLSRTLDLSTTPAPAHGRLVAVAAAELAAPLWTAPAGPPVASAASASAPASVAVTAASAGAPDGGLRLSVFGDVRGFREGAGLLAGGGVALAAAGREPWRLGLDLVANHGARGLTLGRGTATLASVGLSVTASRDRDATTLSAGGGARVGVARLNGEPMFADVTGSALWGMWGGPMISGAARVAVTARVRAFVQAEAGWAFGRLVGRESGAQALAVGGAWLAAQLGLELMR